MNKTIVKPDQEVNSKEAKEEIRNRRIISPQVDIFEDDEKIILVANMPGVSEENIEIVLEKDELTITGSVNQPDPENYRKVYGENVTGDYRRRFILSDIVDRDRIDATLMNGILILNLSKVETAQPQHIPVHAKS